MIEMFWSRAAQALAPRVGICNFDIVCNLSIVIWDFSAVSGKANSFCLNQLELTLTFPCLLFCPCSCNKGRINRLIRQQAGQKTRREENCGLLYVEDSINLPFKTVTISQSNQQLSNHDDQHGQGIITGHVEKRHCIRRRFGFIKEEGRQHEKAKPC